MDEIMMEEHHKYDTDFKLKYFGYGEWIEEPDEVKFEFKGFKCHVIRIVKREPFAKEEAYFGGHLCAYVLIPVEHPYHHKIYNDMQIDCHYGLTYGEVSDGHWIGFDCAHMGDIVPSMKKLRDTNPEMKKWDEEFPLSEEMKNSPLFCKTYKNVNYCIEECKSIVEQLLVIKDLVKKEIE